MKLSSLNFDLPFELLAQYPLPFRDDSRMLVLHKSSGDIEHKGIKDILSFFDDGDVFVFNDTKIFPARLVSYKEKTHAQIDIFLIRELDSVQKFWDVRVEPARKIRIGNKLYFEGNSRIVAEVIDNTTSRGRTIRFITDYDTNEEFKKNLYSLGSTPLSDYICRPIMDEAVLEKFVELYNLSSDVNVDNFVCQLDRERYQTVFARGMDSVVVPASGLHFSKNLLKKMEIKGIENKFISTQVSLGNFRSIDVEDLSKFKIDSERLIIGGDVAAAVNVAIHKKKRICLIGTEVLRSVEYVMGVSGLINSFDGWMNKFIYPPYTFANNYALLANFYQPMSVQQMATLAIGGAERVMAAYDVAIKNNYRFGDYGDAMLIID